MIGDFFKYCLILFVFSFCTTGLVPALLKNSSSSPQSAKSFNVSVNNSFRNAELMQAVITRAPLAGSARRTDQFVVNENEVEEDYLSRKGISKYTSSGAAFAVVFQPSLTILRRLLFVYGSIPDGLFNKVYLLIQVFRI